MQNFVYIQTQPSGTLRVQLSYLVKPSANLIVRHASTTTPRSFHKKLPLEDDEKLHSLLGRAKVELPSRFNGRVSQEVWFERSAI